jgi:hypothetical protein
MLKIGFLKSLGIAALAAPLMAVETMARGDAADDADALVGLWEAVIEGGGTTYGYVYSMSRGSYIATGSIDENFMNFKYSPTMGTYTRGADGSYKYRERGYAFDMKGKNVGTFTSVGTFRLDTDGNTFRGPGTFTQYDMHSKPVASENFALKATRVPV